MRHDVVNGLLLALLEKADVLLRELSYQLGEEVERVCLVLGICICAANHIDYASNNVGLSQGLEEGLVFAELIECSACVQRHVQIIVLVRKFVNERADNHSGFLFEDLLHALLVWSKFRLCLISIMVAIVTCLPLVLHFRLNLLLNEFDHERRQRVLVEMAQKAVENFAFLVKQKIFKRGILLLVEHLLHNLGEIAAENRQGLLVFVEEAAKHVHERVLLLLGLGGRLSLIASHVFILRDCAYKFGIRLIGISWRLTLLAVFLDILLGSSWLSRIDFVVVATFFLVGVEDVLLETHRGHLFLRFI